MYNRKFKVTLTVEVPISDSYPMNPDGIETLLETYLDGLHPEIFEINKEPLENIHKDWTECELEPSEDNEDITNFPDPVGFIAPDGKFYGGNVGYDPLMHILYAKEVWEAYKDKINENTIKKYGYSNGGLDYDLERWGFIKIRPNEVIYYVPYEKTIPPILWTKEQCATVMRYIEKTKEIYNCGVKFKDICGKSTYVTKEKFAKMSDADIINCFRCN